MVRYEIQVSGSEKKCNLNAHLLVESISCLFISWCTSGYFKNSTGFLVDFFRIFNNIMTSNLIKHVIIDLIWINRTGHEMF